MISISYHISELYPTGDRIMTDFCIANLWENTEIVVVVCVCVCVAGTGEVLVTIFDAESKSA